MIKLAGAVTSKRAVSDLRAYVQGLLSTYGVPAVSMAIWRDNRLHQAAAGVLNIASGVEATTGSLFQIGSISKVFTASLIMLLVDRGKIDLDVAVKQYLRDFHVSDSEATQTITIRHLLNHTSGLVSDSSFIDDAYESGNAISRYVDRCFLLPQVHKDIGRRFSYSNAAYVIAGRIIEIVTGLSWRRAVEDFILKPLAMDESVACPLQLIRHRAAIGHMLSGGRERSTPAVSLNGFLPMGLAPAASVLSMSAADLLKFGRAHLNGGKSDVGTQWMSRTSTDSMRELQVAVPAPCIMLERAWGIGWGLAECAGVQAFGHAGGTVGQQALLQVIPEHDLAFSVQVNGMTFGGAPVLEQVLGDILHEVCGVRVQKAQVGNPAKNPTRFSGSYGATGFTFQVTEKDGELSACMQLEGSESLTADIFKLQHIGGDRFASFSQSGERMDDCTFLEPDGSGTPQYLFYGYRLHQRVRTGRLSGFRIATQPES